MEATECGAACLAMVLAYYGCWIPLEKMRVDCGVSRDGSKALNIIRAAREYSMVARGYRCQPERLADLPFPMILFWEFNHFVVLRGVRKGKYYLNDPAAGPRTVTADQFSKSFTGVALAMSTGEDFEKRISERPSLWREIGSYIKGNTSPMWFVFLVSLLMVMPGIVAPVFSKIFIDDVLLQNSQSWMRPLITAFLVVGVISSMLTWMQQTILNRFQQKLSIGFSSRFFWHLMRLPMNFFAQRYAGDLNARVQINDRIAALVSGELATNAVSMLMVVFYGIVMILYDLWMTIGVIALNMFSLLMLKVFSKVREDSMHRMQKEYRKLAGVSVNGVSIIETLKANGLEDEFFSKWSGYHGNMVIAQQRFSVWTNILQLFPEITSALTTILVLGVGSFRITEGVLTIGGLVAFSMLASSFSAPFAGLMRVGENLQQAKVDIAQINDVMRYERDNRYQYEDLDSESEAAEEMLAALKKQGGDAAAGTIRRMPSTGRLSGHVEVRDLTFGYSIKSPPLFKGLNLEIHPGQRLALVGSSGSGKSTLVRLIVGLLKPWSGEVFYDGVSLESYDPAVLAHSIAYVDQEIVLFEGTLRENLSLWDQTVSDFDITQALRDADILADISQRPQRYETEVSENGRNFSGGQRQRLEIARALTANPSILVFDEATAALDPITELRIDQNIRRRGCSSIIAAHRLSTVRDADQILVFKDGEIIERGTHDDLVALEDSNYLKLVSQA